MYSTVMYSTKILVYLMEKGRAYVMNVVEKEQEGEKKHYLFAHDMMFRQKVLQ